MRFGARASRHAQDQLSDQQQSFNNINIQTAGVKHIDIVNW